MRRCGLRVAPPLRLSKKMPTCSERTGLAWSELPRSCPGAVTPCATTPLQHHFGREVLAGPLQRRDGHLGPPAVRPARRSVRFTRPAARPQRRPTPRAAERAGASSTQPTPPWLLGPMPPVGPPRHCATMVAARQRKSHSCHATFSGSGGGGPGIVEAGHQRLPE